MQNAPSLPSLPGPLWPGVVASNRALNIGQMELNCVGSDETVLTFKLHTYVEINYLK